MGSLLKCYICNAAISYFIVQDQNCNIKITDIQLLGAKYRGLFLHNFLYAATIRKWCKTFQFCFKFCLKLVTAYIFCNTFSVSMERRQFITKLNSLDLHPYIFVFFIRLYCILGILFTFQPFFFFFTSSCAAPGVLCGRKMNKTYL